MLNRLIMAAIPLMLANPVFATMTTAPTPVSSAQGVLELTSAYPLDETISRIKADIAAKGIRFFADIDQSALAASADIRLPPSRLLLFGNPPLGIQFLTATPYAGLDWPVRMLVFERADGSVAISWTDFRAIETRYAMRDRAAQIKMANEVAASIASSALKK